MNRGRWTGIVTLMVIPAFCGIWARADEKQRLRPGLTPEQSQKAIRIAEEPIKELRRKVEGAEAPKADRREYTIGVEYLAEKPRPGAAKAQPAPEGTRAVVTSYRYFDDTTVMATVDLASGKVVDISEAKHIRTPLSDAEYEEAKKMARAQVDDVKLLYEKLGDRITVYPQFSQYKPPGEDRVHRVVHLTYRVGDRDLSAPRPIVDLTTRDVTVRPRPDAAAEPKR